MLKIDYEKVMDTLFEDDGDQAEAIILQWHNFLEQIEDGHELN